MIGLLLYLFVVGIVAGFLARLLVPGRDPMGFWASVLLGVIGSFVGGFLGYVLFGKDLDEAEFFDTRGGFQRVVAEIDRLLMSYGDDGLPDAQSAKAMRDRSQQRLSQLDGQRAQDMRQRLELMAKAFEEAKQPGLANLVRDYVTQRFSKQE